MSGRATGAPFQVLATPPWLADLSRIKEFMVERELAGQTIDERLLERFDAALERALDILAFAPHTCRRCESRPELRELVVPFGGSGCVALFAIEPGRVVLLSLRHQHERDFR